VTSTEVDNSPPAIWLGPLNPPPEKSFITLSHAISWIAFRHSISGPQLAMALGIGKVRDASQAITDAEKDDAIAHAVERLTDLGSAGAIEFWARQFRDVLDDGNEILTEPIRPFRLADYRWFDTLDDSLHRGSGLAWDHNRRQPLYPLDQRHFRFVTVNRDDLLREFPRDLAIPVDLVESEIVKVDNKRAPPLSDAQLARWWEGLATVRDAMSEPKLLRDVRERFPDSFIARERIRALTNGRKRGPKPKFSGKATA